MGIDEALENPEQFRVGNDFRATHRVFPIEVDGNKYVAKMPGTVSAGALFKYYIQDHFSPFTSRLLGSVTESFSEEARKLDLLGGYCAPRLIGYNPNSLVIIKDFVNGASLKDKINAGEETSGLEGAVGLIRAIHGRGVIIGDSHAKNVLFGKYSPAIWVDFDGVFDDTNFPLASALDLYQFLYSTYSLVRNSFVTESAARAVLGYGDHLVLDNLREMVDQTEPGVSLWFKSRIPVFDKE
jgi:tRNA A-37 threonylcarbamoyl transferase component Bud32